VDTHLASVHHPRCKTHVQTNLTQFFSCITILI
jgi:hypothetical protein